MARVEHQHELPARAQNPDGLGDRLRGLGRTVQHFVSVHDVEAVAFEWQLFRIGPDGDARRVQLFELPRSGPDPFRRDVHGGQTGAMRREQCTVRSRARADFEQPLPVERIQLELGYGEMPARAEQRLQLSQLAPQRRFGLHAVVLLVPLLI